VHASAARAPLDRSKLPSGRCPPGDPTALAAISIPISPPPMIATRLPGFNCARIASASETQGIIAGKAYRLGAENICAARYGNPLGHGRKSIMRRRAVLKLLSVCSWASKAFCCPMAMTHMTAPPPARECHGCGATKTKAPTIRRSYLCKRLRRSVSTLPSRCFRCMALMLSDPSAIEALLCPGVFREAGALSRG
jgi:hypothetical protein